MPEKKTDITHNKITTKMIINNHEIKFRPNVLAYKQH